METEAGGGERHKSIGGGIGTQAGHTSMALGGVEIGERNNGANQERNETHNVM